MKLTHNLEVNKEDQSLTTELSAKYMLLFLSNIITCMNKYDIEVKVTYQLILHIVIIHVHAYIDKSKKEAGKKLCVAQSTPVTSCSTVCTSHWKSYFTTLVNTCLGLSSRRAFTAASVTSHAT